jgi:hypothetical protein
MTAHQERCVVKAERHLQIFSTPLTSSEDTVPSGRFIVGRGEERRGEERRGALRKAEVVCGRD